ncbi:peptidoglycan-binding domain-containing protein [Oceaniradius stylonematis]|uniref:peptidoglycan-binding domain-containing protein n=1 Tax=Oceaniradius stylonematis TaxID=2184161 RepID=UPI002740134B|nr:peptidoglycan-binding domain-containing protein [Oceaniradius stylonematis]
MSWIIALISGFIAILTVSLHGRSTAERNVAGRLVLYIFGILSFVTTVFSVQQIYQGRFGPVEVTPQPAPVQRSDENPRSLNPAPEPTPAPQQDAPPAETTPREDPTSMTGNQHLEEFIATRARDIKIIQTLLYQKGCYHGEVDGIWGSQTEQAIDRFNTRNRTAVNMTRPTTNSITVLSSPMSFACRDEEPNCFFFNGVERCE